MNEKILSTTTKIMPQWPDDRQYMKGALVVTVKERLRRLQQSCSTGKEFTMGDFAAGVPPQHFNRVEPGTVSRQV